MIKLNEKQIQVIKDSSKLLDIGYDREIQSDSIEESLLIDLAEDLNSKIESLQDEYDDYQKEVEEYYEPRYRDEYDLYGVSRNDF